jgi:hypothetical protein
MVMIRAATRADPRAGGATPRATGAAAGIGPPSIAGQSRVGCRAGATDIFGVILEKFSVAAIRSASYAKICARLRFAA